MKPETVVDANMNERELYYTKVSRLDKRRPLCVYPSIFWTKIRKNLRDRRGPLCINFVQEGDI